NHPNVIELREKALAVRNLAVQNIKGKQKTDKVRYDEKHRHVEFQVGDKVKVFTRVRKKGKSEKLLLRWFSTYLITKKVSDVDYEVQKGMTARSPKDIVHIVVGYYPTTTNGLLPLPPMA